MVGGAAIDGKVVPIASLTDEYNQLFALARIRPESTFVFASGVAKISHPTVARSMSVSREDWDFPDSDRDHPRAAVQL